MVNSSYKGVFFLVVFFPPFFFFFSSHQRTLGVGEFENYHSKGDLVNRRIKAGKLSHSLSLLLCNHSSWGLAASL
jgi:hypothetical protein